MSEQKNETPKRSIRDFFDNEYLNYAKYVVESRAIPSVIDGFTTAKIRLELSSIRTKKRTYKLDGFISAFLSLAQ